MWISPATWRKALRWNRLVLAVVLLLAAAPWSASAQEPPGKMILLRGPVSEQGLPFMPRDVSLFFRGEYEYAGSRIDVYFMQRPLTEAQEWRTGSCAVSVRVLDYVPLGKFYYRPFGQSSTLLFRTEGDVDVCTLIPAFERRFSYFLGTTPKWLLPPFPAVVELSAGSY